MNKKFADSVTAALEANTNMPMAAKQLALSWHLNATPDDYELCFRGHESYYYHIPALEEEGYNVGSRSGRSSYYVKADTIIEESSLGNVLLKPLDWKITQNTKKIGKHLCYQALATERLYSRKGFYYTRDVVAWFTPEIPLSFGPRNYKGLSGLILQVERKEFTLTATKINLNPDKKELKIIRLNKKGKVITEEEANNRIKEMTEARKKEYGG